MFLNNKKTAYIKITAVFLFLVDRLLKFLAINNYFDNFQIINDWFKLSFVPNPNIAFSIPVSGLILNILIAIILIFLLYYYLFYFKNKNYLNASLLFAVFLGAVSNFADRLRFGFVIDYLDLKYFTVFNLADFMIVLGIFFIFILNIKKNKS